MQATLQEDPTGDAPESSTPSFDPDVSRDLELIDAATGHFRNAWRVLTPLANRHAFACGLVMETAAMMGDLASERRSMEDQAGL